LEKQLSLTNDESLKYLELREKNYFINDEYLKEKNFDYKDYYTKAIDNITDLKIEDKNKLQNSINSNQFKNMKSKLETLLIEQLEKRV
jgi:hypothetical protein